MPKRLLVTFDSPVAVRGNATPVSPDGGLVQVDTVPTCPSTLPLGSTTQPSIGRALIPRHGQSGFGHEQALVQFLADNSSLLEGFHCIMNNQEVPNEIAVALFLIDERISPTTQKVTFYEALKLLFQVQKHPVQVVNCCFGVDLRKPSHRDYA